MEKSLKKTMRIVLLIVLFTWVVPVMSVCAKDLVIVLDAGHGGNDSGAVRKWGDITYVERTFTHKIALYAKEELEKYEGVTVYLTKTSSGGRVTDRETRLRFARARGADALVSLHINSTGEKATTLTGSLGMVPSQAKYPNRLSYAKRARELSIAIQAELNAQVGLYNGGLLASDYSDELGIVLYGMKFKIPSMIIEHCYINNPNDARYYLGSELMLRKMAKADADGIAKYFHLRKKGEAVQPELQTGWVDKEGKKYYYYNDGSMAKNGWAEINGKHYYFDMGGALKTGVLQIGRQLYLTDKDGVRRSGFVRVNKKQYYANAQGRLYTGWKTYKGKKYYFHKRTGAAITGKRKIGSKIYFFSNSSRLPGAMRTGMVSISGKKHFFSRKDGRMMRNYWVKRRGKWYYFGKDGAAYTGTKKRIDGKWYKFNKASVCLNKR